MTNDPSDDCPETHEFIDHLHPYQRPCGDLHHTDVPLALYDQIVGAKLSGYLGDLFLDSRMDSPRVQWQSIVRALRVHGLQIVDAPKEQK